MIRAEIISFMEYPVVRLLANNTNAAEFFLGSAINYIWDISRRLLSGVSNFDSLCRIEHGLMGVHGSMWMTVNQSDITFFNPITRIKCVIWLESYNDTHTLFIHNEGKSRGQIPCKKLTEILRGLCTSAAPEPRYSYTPDRVYSRATELRLHKLRKGQPADCLFRLSPEDPANTICHCIACAVLRDLICDLRAFRNRHPCY